MSFTNFKKSKLCVIACAITSAISPPSHAQLEDQILVTAKAEQSLESVLPTAHIIDLEQIELIQAKDLTTLLEQSSGVTITDTGGRGSATSVFLRGTASSQTIVLIDGVRVGSASLGSATLNSYPIEAIERIEIVKGPMSGIYGADAIGGVIHIFTKSKAADKNGSFSVTFGSDSLQEVGLSFGAGNEDNNFYISAQYEDTDGIDRTSITSGGNDDIDEFEQSAFSFRGNLQINDSNALSLAVLQSENTAEFDNTFGDDTGFFTDTDTLSIALGIESQLTDTIKWRNKLGYNQDDSSTPAFDSEFKTERSNINSELEISFNEHSNLLLGFDYYDEELTANADFAETDRDNNSIYALYQATLGKFGLLANIRHDDNSAYGDETNGSIALDYQLTSSTRLTLSYGTAFAAPSFNQLYFPNFGNSELLPEESESFELSLRGANDKLNWRISAYQTDIDNLFSFDPNTFLAANIGETEIRGVELEASTTWNRWLFSANLELLSAEDQTTGTELDDRPEKSLLISASRSWDKWDFRIALNAEDKRFDLQGQELSGFILFDSSLKYQLSSKASLQLTVDNLFDKDYTVNLISSEQRYETEGRQIRLKLQTDF